MPRGDGSGPPSGSAGRGRRMKGNSPGAGRGENCVCPTCGEKVPHKQGTPCLNKSCPKYGTRMIRG